MSDIDFPGSPNRPITETETDKLHAEAFRVLEGRISDCVIMAGLAASLGTQDHRRRHRSGPLHGLPHVSNAEEAAGGLRCRVHQR
jgi:hypothetical protein